MLLEYASTYLVNAMQREPLTDAEAEGAVRFFVGYTPGALFSSPEERTLINQLPDELKRTHLDHLAKTDDQEKVESARMLTSMSCAAGSKCGQSFGERRGCAAGLSHITRRVHAEGTHDSRSATTGSTFVARHAGM